MKSRIAHAAPVQVVVRKNTDGAHMCAYVPWHEGDYTMTIFLDGRILAQKMVRVRPASERTEAEIQEAVQKQEEANKRRAAEHVYQAVPARAETNISYIASPNISSPISSPNVSSPRDLAPSAARIVTAQEEPQWERDRL